MKFGTQVRISMNNPLVKKNCLLNSELKISNLVIKYINKIISILKL